MTQPVEAPGTVLAAVLAAVLSSCVGGGGGGSCCCGSWALRRTWGLDGLGGIELALVVGERCFFEGEPQESAPFSDTSLAPASSC